MVTGGAKGLGLACVARFLNEGAKVVIADNDGEAGTAAIASLPGGANVVFAQCDVSVREELEAAIQRCVVEWGGIDVLLNNAAIAPQADILSIGDHTFERVIAINLKAAVVGTQVAAKHMIAGNTGGVILNMSSVNAMLTIPNMLAYNVAKGGLNQLTRNAAVALAPHRIRVCGIGPGTVLTDLTRNTVWTDEAARRAILARTPLGRPGEPDEIAAIAAFLASDDASYVTGETIYADGGRMSLNYTVAVP